MPSIENLQTAKSRRGKFREIHSQSRGRLDKPMRMLERRNELQRLPAASTANRSEDGFLRGIENRENSSFEAEFSFELTGTQACSTPVAEVEAQILQRRTIHKGSKEVQAKCSTF